MSLKNIVYFSFIKISTQLLKYIPRSIAYRIIPYFFKLFSYFTYKKRAYISQNLQNIYQYGIKADFTNPCYKVSQVFENFGKYWIDFWGPNCWRETLLKKITIEGEPYIRHALEEKKSIIILTAHIGNWELGISKIAHMGLPIAGLYWEHPDPKINQLFLNQRKLKNLNVISIYDNAVNKCIDVLRNGNLLGMIADIDYAGTGIMVDWWNKKERISRAPIVFAKRTHSIIIPALCILDGSQYKIIIEKPLNVHKKEFEKIMTKQILEIYKKWMMNYPLQRFVFQQV